MKMLYMDSIRSTGSVQLTCRPAVSHGDWWPEVKEMSA